MDFTFADDANQRSPTRPGMGPLVAVGGIHVLDGSVKKLEDGLRERCREYGFGLPNRFKWSPGPEEWMARNLVQNRRAEFFETVLTLAAELDVRATVVICDANHEPANSGCTAEDDTLKLFLERVERRLHGLGTDGVVIVDRPSGGRAEERKFILECAEKLQSGTKYVRHKRIALNVLSASSDNSRCIQLADLVTSCTVAHVGGERRFSPRTFQAIKLLLCSDDGRFGGVGLKIHPDFKHANLYHWLCGDEFIKRGSGGLSLPVKDRGYLYRWEPFAA